MWSQQHIAGCQRRHLVHRGKDNSWLTWESVNQNVWNAHCSMSCATVSWDTYHPPCKRCWEWFTKVHFSIQHSDWLQIIGWERSLDHCTENMFLRVNVALKQQNWKGACQMDVKKHMHDMGPPSFLFDCRLQKQIGSFMWLCSYSSLKSHSNVANVPITFNQLCCVCQPRHMHHMCWSCFGWCESFSC